LCATCATDGGLPPEGRAYHSRYYTLRRIAYSTLQHTMGLLDRRSGVRKISEVVPLTRRLIRDPCGAGPRGTRLRSWRRPTWLLNAHEDLDRAVFAAYGWPPDLSDEEVLLELLTLNLERSKTH
jgi:hypothetical protein